MMRKSEGEEANKQNNNVTMMLTIIATGDIFVPPFFVFPQQVTDLDFIPAEHFKEPEPIAERSSPTNGVSQQQFIVLTQADSKPGPSSNITSTEPSKPGSSTVSAIFLKPRPSSPVTSITSKRTIVTNDFQKIMNQISPVTSSSKARLKRRKWRPEQIEVLTSSPYKNELLKKKRVAEEKKQVAAKKN
ncbi:hypothetical protein ILUMI_26460 [Ignelater luminosus]|uniref:Uncharacterized protein n=1 Tax=Ignelater luminosus TaxID=2038154 RepID=A0A8K0C3S0_IGNLU|nr:hypothetical protein ILUMI_26460 [Ignelater luminosus]